MTEDEAKTKWCPHVRHAESGSGSWNRATWSDGDVLNINHHDGMYSCACIGSTCMAWRWLPLVADDAFKAAILKAATEIGDNTSSKHQAAAHVIKNRAAYGLPPAPFDGYCGLAGRP